MHQFEDKKTFSPPESLLQGELAQNIADSVQVSTQEATSGNQNPDLLESSVAGLRSSVEGFEKSHPQLVQVVNSLSNTLSNLGI